MMHQLQGFVKVVIVFALAFLLADGKSMLKEFDL